MVTREDWKGVVRETRSATDALRLIGWDHNPEGGTGGSKALIGRAIDGNRYWVKQIDNPKSHMVPVNEQIVARCGALIGAPVCTVALIEIPASLSGIVSGVRVKAGVAHGSLEVPDTIPSYSLDYRDQDNNRTRHAGVLALVDWCWGGDLQWLFQETDRRTYSHDHGFYFPGGPDWHESPQAVQQQADQAPPPSDCLKLWQAGLGMRPIALTTFASKLESVTTEQIARVLNAVPSEWPVEAYDLDLIGYFLERRAPQVAARLRAAAEFGVQS